ncbi:MAG: hypothetical protein AVDCRST_MAG09-7, partial [uncultured Sphingomonas sp.]
AARRHPDAVVADPGRRGRQLAGHRLRAAARRRPAVRRPRRDQPTCVRLALPAFRVGGRAARASGRSPRDRLRDGGSGPVDRRHRAARCQALPARVSGVAVCGRRLRPADPARRPVRPARAIRPHAGAARHRRHRPHQARSGARSAGFGRRRNRRGAADGDQAPVRACLAASCGMGRQAHARLAAVPGSGRRRSAGAGGLRRGRDDPDTRVSAAAADAARHLPADARPGSELSAGADAGRSNGALPARPAAAAAAGRAARDCPVPRKRRLRPGRSHPGQELPQPQLSKHRAGDDRLRADGRRARLPKCAASLGGHRRGPAHRSPAASHGIGPAAARPGRRDCPQRPGQPPDDQLGHRTRHGSPSHATGTGALGRLAPVPLYRGRRALCWARRPGGGALVPGGFGKLRAGCGDPPARPRPGRRPFSLLAAGRPEHPPRDAPLRSGRTRRGDRSLAAAL